MLIPTDGSIEAEYEDGFIINETELDDFSPHDNFHNVFRHILMKWSEPEHGKMVRFSMFWKNNRYDVDFRGLPDNARPIRYKKIEADFVGSQMTDKRIMRVGFGYQYTDEQGNNVEEKKEYT